MALPEKGGDLENTWQELNAGIENIYSNNISMQDYARLYTLVYESCTKVPKEGGTLHYPLYNIMSSFLRERNQANYIKFEDLIYEPLLSLYVELWEDYRFSSKVLRGIYSYLNRQWVNHEREKKRRIDVFEAYQLAMMTWEEHLLEPLKNRLSSALLNLIAKERNGETVNTSLISATLESYLEIGITKFEIFTKTSALSFYKEAFEEKFLVETQSFYARESASFLRANSVPEFIKKVETWFNEEQRRAQLYLHESTSETLTQILEHFLLVKHMDSLHAELKPMLQHRQMEDLKRMYNLLSRVSGALDELKIQFQDCVIKEGLSAMEDCKSYGKNVKHYIDTIISVHQRFYCIVVTCFEGEPEFASVFDKACEKFINRNAVTESSGSSNKSAEYLAKYIDHFVKKTDQEDVKIMDKLNLSMVIYKYIEEKDMFESYYSKLLANRLVQQACSNDFLENSMISKMREMCGYEYAAKLQRIVQDVIISRDLNEQFEKEAGSLDIDFSIRVISSSSWPFTSPPLTMSLPQEFEQSVQQFTAFYSSRFKGRNLTWLFNRSRGELLSRCFNQKYTFQATTFQMAVLLQFNNGKTLTFHQLEETTGINSDSLLQTLKSLAKFKLLKGADGNPITKTSSVTLDESFRSKRLKVAIHAPMKSEVKNVEKHVKEDRRFIIQAAIVRIAKDRKVIKHQILVMEVISLLSSKFTPHFFDMNKCIELLIEKEYLKKSEKDGDTYCYLA